jgi:hypothetical protein
VSKEMDRFLANNHSVTSLALDKFEKILARQCDLIRGSPTKAHQNDGIRSGSIIVETGRAPTECNDEIQLPEIGGPRNRYNNTNPSIDLSPTSKGPKPTLQMNNSGSLGQLPLADISQSAAERHHN